MTSRDIVNVVQLVTTVATSVALLVAATVGWHYGWLMGLLVVGAWCGFVFGIWCLYSVIWLIVVRPWQK